MLQTALGFQLKTAATALAGRIVGVKPSLPTSETILAPEHKYKPTISGPSARHWQDAKATSGKQFILPGMGTAQQNKQTIKHGK